MLKSDLWITPDSYKPDHDFDPCPYPMPLWDGLVIPWHGRVFCNPPYSEIDKWITKAINERDNCDSITMLLPAWTDRKWFQRILKYRFYFLPGRIKFIDPENKKHYNPRFGSMYVYIK